MANAQEKVDDISALELSDEEVLNMAMPPEADASNQEEVSEPETEDTPEQEAESSEKEEPTAEASEEKDEEAPVNEDTAMMEAFQKAAAEQTKQEDGSEEVTDEEPEPEKKASKEDKADKAESKDEGGDQKSDDKTPEINYEAEYKKILAPFRANGRDIQVKDVDDALTLMKMGANYNKKMAALKPNLKLMKMLDNNDLLDESKLTYLIDLQNKNPEAIAKFVKDSGIDPLDIDTDKTDEYKPGTYTVDDKDVELDLVLGEIQDTPSFDKTIDLISNKWDDSSKKVLLAEPQLIKVINGQVENGIYDQIFNIVESERMLGRLTELSDLEAYKHVGDILQEQGAFDKKSETPNEPEAKAPTTVKKSEDPKLKDRRRAAAPPKGAPSKAKPTFDPLSMSDEEFEKAAASMGL